jgi:hypothetical protein
MRVIQIGNLLPDLPNFKNRTAGRIYDADGVSPTVNCCGGGNREPMIIEIIYEQQEADEAPL